MRKFRVGSLATLILAAAGLSACGGGGSGQEPKSSDASLAGLTFSAGTLEPAFDPATTTYSVGPEMLPDAATLTPVTSDAGATVTVNGSAVASGGESPTIALAMGTTTVPVVVTAADGTTTQAYAVSFERTSAGLASLVLSAGTLSPAFDSSTLSYTVGPAIEPGRVTLTPTLVDPAASVTVNGTPGTSGTPSAEITFSGGITPVTVEVTAREGTAQSYTVVFDRSLTGQQAYLKASDANVSSWANFGTSVSISGDTLVVGAIGANQGVTSAKGAAYVFVRSGSSWTQEAILTASNGEDIDLFGSRVAIDGDTVVVGAPGEDGDGSDESDNSAENTGAAYVFVRVGNTWTQQAYLKGSNSEVGDPDGAFGTTVAMAGDTVVVGDRDNQYEGAVYVFVRSGSLWEEQAYLKASNAEAFDNFGRSVAIAGETVVVGAWSEDGDGSSQSDNSAEDSGAVYVFVRSGVNWTQQAYLKASAVLTEGGFGRSVGISGETLVVGESLNESIFVFVRSSGSWAVEANISAPAMSSGDFGWKSIAISGDTLVAGDIGGDDWAGIAYVFLRSGSTWAPADELQASNSESQDSFGTSVAISSDGTLVIGATYEAGDGSSQSDNSIQEAGAAYIFR